MPDTDGDEELTKIVVDLPNHWATGGESMWARPLGNDLFELRNVPFYAYGLNFLDVVRALEPAPDQKPVARELVRASGHRTLRVHFTDALPAAERAGRARPQATPGRRSARPRAAEMPGAELPARGVRQLVFVRHGESVHHVSGLTGGWTDTPLTETGRREIVSLNLMPIPAYTRR